MRIILAIFAFSLCFVFSISSTAQVHLEVPLKPMPFKADGKTHLLYELHITNFSSKAFELTQISVFNKELESKPLEIFHKETLTQMISSIGVRKKGEAKRVIDAGQRIVVFFKISLGAKMAVPNALKHRLYYKTKPSHTDSLKIDGKGFAIRSRTPPIINPPLRGDGWVSFNGISNISDHRRTIIPLNGRANISQRFAIDWVKVGADGKIFKNSVEANEEIYGYGEDVLAVADAVVVDVKDGIPDNNMSSKKKAVPITLKTIGGNYVILDIGNGLYAFYGHLIPNSITVKIGDKVEVGKVIGKIGNSGNSDGPHLHFHISNGNSPLGAEGVPYLINSFEVRGEVTAFNKLFNGVVWDPTAKTAVDLRFMEIPTENSIVRFPETIGSDSSIRIKEN